MFKDSIDLSRKIEHTLLKPTATHADIEKLCGEAKKHSFRAVCVNPFYVYKAKEILSGTGIKVCTVIGFPLGSNSRSSKIYEAMEAVKDGADELDVVINLGVLKELKWDEVKKEISDFVMATPKSVHKVIIETCYLSDEEKEMACKIIIESGAEFIKTSTGYGSSGAKVKDIRLIKSIVGDKLKIKASGGIKTLKQAITMVKVGADTIGTSSGVLIIKEFNSKKR